MKNIIAFLFVFFLIVFLSTMNYSKHVEYKEQKKIADSLQAELFPCEVELNRHKVALEIFMKRNPKAAAEYENIISQETE